MDDLRISYADGLKLVDKLAQGLARFGLQRGDRLAVIAPNLPAYLLLAFACWRQGYILVGINSLYATPMLAKRIRDAEPSLIVTVDASDVQKRVTSALGDDSTTRLVVLKSDSSDVAGKQRPVAAGNLGWHDILADARHEPAADIEPVTDVAVLQYTGGTTGEPKGAMLTHGNISACTTQLMYGMPELAAGNERFIAMGPFSHIIGITLIMVAATAIAAEIVIPQRFHPEETSQFCLDEAITVIFGVPTVFNAIANSHAARSGIWLSLRYSMCGGAPLPAEIAASFRRVTGCDLLQGYGLSESAAGICFTPPGKPVPAGSAGYPLAGSRVEIRSVDDPTEVVHLGEIGEIAAAGPQIMRGYWRQQARTEEVMIGDLLRTGDTGYMDEAGAIFIVDRIKDLIIASGYNVYPRQVEEAIYKHPSVREVAVIGIKDDYRGESVKAVVSLLPGTTLGLEELQQFLSSELSPIEIPKALDVMEELPKTAVGKISKLDLRDTLRGLG